MHPAAPPVYRPQSAPGVLQKKASATHTGTDGKLGRQSDPPGAVQLKTRAVAPPAYRPLPTPRVLQTKQTARAVQSPPRSAVAAAPAAASRTRAATLQARPPQMQLKVGNVPMLPRTGRPASIQRSLSKYSAQGEAEVVARFMAQLIKEEEMERQAFLLELDAQDKIAKPPLKKLAKKKKSKAPKVDKEAQNKKEGKEKEYTARELERQQERAKELAAAAVRWHDVLTRNDAAPYVFGLLNDGYISLAPAHRCFLSSYEKDNQNNRKDNRFGLSRRIFLTQALAGAYQAKYNAVPADCVLHLHCDADGSVLSFSIKYLAQEQQAGNNVVFPDIYKNKAADYVGDINGNNVTAKVGQFS